MRKSGMNLGLATVLFLTQSVSAAGVSVISTSLDQKIEAPRWMYDSKLKVKGGALIESLVEAKHGLIQKERGRCLAALNKSYGLGKSLGPWIAWNHLQCALLPDAKGNLSAAALNAAVAKVEAQPKWLLYGPAALQLRAGYVSALLALAEVQSKGERRLAWATLDKLQQVRGWLQTEEKAKVYRWAGELAFIEQNLTTAVDFLQRSLSEKESVDLRDRVDSIRSSLIGKKKIPTPVPVNVAAPIVPPTVAIGGSPMIPAVDLLAPVQPTEDLGMSDQERELWQRMDRAYNSQDFVSAIEDGLQLIIKFPGSKRTVETSDRVLDIYLTISSRSEDRYRHVRQTVVKEMGKADAGRLTRWANNAYARGNYLDALNMAEKAYAKWGGHPDSTKVLLLAGKAAVASGEYTSAQEHFNSLTRQHGGTVEAAEATFRLGLLELRRKRYAEAAAFFERVLALSNGSDFEHKALYWQWRAQQKIDLAKSVKFAQPLIAKYQLSYYGMRAQAEINGGFIEIKNKPVSAKTDLRYLQSDRLAFERAVLLLKAGWFKEAEKELESLPEAQTAEERLIRSRLWASAFRYDLAIQNMNKAFEENPELMQSSVVRIVFPQEYQAAVARESKTFDMPENWIRSLMRQESSFRPDARSSSNAMGVMQLIPPTAQEVAMDLKLKNFKIPESVLDPDINIKLGTSYMARMLRTFSGNMPLSLAAYNAGPTRLRRWLNARKDLAGLEVQVTSNPEVEIWMDELPWEETSFYVKAILRNWLIYRLLDGSKVSLSDPIWVDAKGTKGLK